jgi:CheY-like chemotaxis protein
MISNRSGAPFEAGLVPELALESGTPSRSSAPSHTPAGADWRDAMSDSHTPSRGKQILIVDDDSSVLNVLTRVLDDYRLIAARDPHEALQIAARATSLDLLITDYMMPSMTGDEVIGYVRRFWPSVQTLILTGHGDILEAEPWWQQQAHLAKPMDLARLRATVAALIGPPSGGKLSTSSGSLVRSSA